jgi:hypothetical protein
VNFQSLAGLHTSKRFSVVKRDDRGDGNERQRREARYSIVHHEDGWTVLGTPVLRAGRLCYLKLTDTYRASINERDVLFPKLAKGRHPPGESPLDKWKRPKVEFLFLFALRQMSFEHSPGRKCDPFKWSTMAINSSIAERESQTGKKLGTKNLRYAKEVANSFEKFEDHVLSRLFGRAVGRQGAGAVLRRYARWMDLIDEIHKEGIPTAYQKFLRAVESAAKEASGVPTKKAVKDIFNAGLSQNQLGEDTTFRSLMQRLRFEWLPNDARGPGRNSRKSVG